MKRSKVNDIYFNPSPKYKTSKCIVCERRFLKIRKKRTSKRSALDTPVFRGSNYITCSKECSEIYRRIYHRIYSLKKIQEKKKNE